MIRKLTLLLVSTLLCFLGGELYLRSWSSTRLGFDYSKKEGFFNKAIEFDTDPQTNSLKLLSLASRSWLMADFFH